MAFDLPVAVHVHDPQGCDRYIGRRTARGFWPNTVFGNPYHIGRDGDRATVLAKYESHVRSRPDLMAALPELRGLRLGCWCAKPGQVLTADEPNPPT